MLLIYLLNECTEGLCANHLGPPLSSLSVKRRSHTPVECNSGVLDCIRVLSIFMGRGRNGGFLFYFFSLDFFVV